MKEEINIYSLDPNEYMTITRDSFISKYGKAAERFIEQIEKETTERCLQALPKKREPLNLYLRSRMQEHIGYNLAIDESISAINNKK